MNETYNIEDLQQELTQIKKENNLLYEKIAKLKMDNDLLKRKIQDKQYCEKDLDDSDDEIIKDNPTQERIILKQKGLEEHWDEKVKLEICEGLSIIAKRDDEKQCYILENDFPLYFPITQEELDQRGYTKL